MININIKLILILRLDWLHNANSINDDIIFILITLIMMILIFHFSQWNKIGGHVLTVVSTSFLFCAHSSSDSKIAFCKKKKQNEADNINKMQWYFL